VTAPGAPSARRGGGRPANPARCRIGLVRRLPALVLLSLTACAHQRSWNETHAGFDGESSRDCLACHGSMKPTISVHVSHPLEVGYAEIASRANSALKPEPDVLRAGVALPGGRLECRTCHSATSPWKYHLALPPGADVRPAVDPHNRATFDSPQVGAPPPGSAVSAKPLCQACHYQ